MKRVPYLLAIFVVISFSACSTDSPEVENKSKKSISNSSMAGTWDAKEMTYTSTKNPNKSLDMMNEFKTSLTMTIKTNGTYTYSAKMMGMSTNQSGTMKKDGNKITSDNPNFKMTLSGNILTLLVENQSWDFGDGREPAISKAVFKRR